MTYEFAYDDRQVSQPRSHSGLGIASFVIGLLGSIVMFGLIIVAGAMEASTPGGINEESLAAAVLGLFLIGDAMALLVALGLGMASFFDRDKKKIFGILGFLFALIMILSAGLLLAVGMVNEAQGGI